LLGVVRVLCTQVALIIYHRKEYVTTPQQMYSTQYVAVTKLTFTYLCPVISLGHHKYVNIFKTVKKL